MKKLAVLSICVVLVFGLSFTSSAMAADEDDVSKVITNLIEAINDRNAELFSSLYYQSPISTIFNPWGRFIEQGGMTMPPSGTLIESNHPHATMLGNNAAFVTGYFTVVPQGQGMSAPPGGAAPPEGIAPPEGAVPPEMNAEYYRGTLVLQKIGGKWLIVHEHYSTQP